MAASPRTDTRRPALAYFISGHGFGHASRSIEVINALGDLCPELRVIVRTSAPRWLFARTVRRGIASGAGDEDTSVVVDAADVDPGMVQHDSLRLDVAASLERARGFMRTFEERVDEAAAFVTARGVQLVAADIPPLGVAAARRAGVPGIAIGNFTWDWIYAAYDGARELAAAMAAAYAEADAAFRLPMHGGFASIAPIVDMPLVARRSARDAAGTRQALHLPADRPLVLVSFGGLGLDALDLDALSRLDGYGVVLLGSGAASVAGGRPRRQGSLFICTEADLDAVDRRYEDLVRAVDVVVSKPGYGIIAECAANDTALLYTSRGHFAEYDVLVAALPRLLRAAPLDQPRLFAGDWREALDALLAQPPVDAPRVDGADVIARALLDRLGLAEGPA